MLPDPIHPFATPDELLREYQHDFHQHAPPRLHGGDTPPPAAAQGPEPSIAGRTLNGVAAGERDQLTDAYTQTAERAEQLADMAQDLATGLRQTAAACPHLLVTADLFTLATFAAEIQARLQNVRRDLP